MKEIREMLFDGTNDDFKRIVDSYKLLLYSVVYAASAYADADDIVQETFIYAYYHWGMLRDKNKLSSWLCAIAKNKAAHAIRTAKKTVSLENISNMICVSSPESTFLRREERMEIRRRLESLSEKYREVVMLYYFAEKSIPEIASLLEVPKGTVKFRLHEGRKKLKEELIHMMKEEKKQATERNIWENIEKELHRAREAFNACRKGEANAICGLLIEQFKDMDPAMLSRDELRMMIHIYNQKFYTNMHMESREKNIVYCEKCVELAELSGDEKLMLERYSLYAIALTNIGKKNESLLYYKKALMLAEKLGDISQIALLHYWLGTGYLNKDIPDITNAKSHFEKAVTYKDELLKSDRGKCVYTLTYSAFVAMSRVKNLDKLSGFHSTEICIVKTENGLQVQEQPGFCGGKYSRFCTIDIFTHLAYIRPFLSNAIREGYAFETAICSRYEVVSMHARTETPAGTFENCLHIRYTEKTEDPTNFKRNGVRDLFYAPNVGLVLMHFKAIGDFEYTVKLTEYAVTPVKNGDLCDRYFPLTVGNVWYYDLYGADGTRFDKEDYENRFEVVAKCRRDTLASSWAPIPFPKIETDGKHDAITCIAHSGWICRKD